MPKYPMLEYLWIVPLLPLLGSAVNGLFGAKWPNKIVNWVAIGSTGLSFLGALEAVREFFESGQVLFRKEFFAWIAAGNFRAGFDLQMDQLTVVMVLVVTGVGWLIHIYATGYMAHEGGYYRFFSYLNLFMFFMLILVLAANYVLLFVGWEGVGLSSYLLIGFYFLKKSASDAGKKAFIVNRIGDFGFMLGMFLLFRAFHTLDFQAIFTSSTLHGWPVELSGHLGTLTFACLLLFMGACGKSAQLPPYVWLPDAMAGPTPVSALIHAATMVTAGVFLVARMFPVFEGSIAAMNVVAIIGAITMLLAALLAMVQDDIKRVLAYSTISQLAYMMAALGVGAGNAGIFHLYTHAWFKALLFLGAGSVIHAVHTNNMSEMGGLKKFMPTTYWTFVVATLALSGIFPFAGFWSKDEILTEAFRVGHGTAAAHGTPAIGYIVYGVGVLTAFLTAFYMSRAVHLTFYGDYRGSGHPHESPRAMTLPLQILGVLSVVAGFVGIPAWRHGFAAWVGVGGEVKVSSANFWLIAISLLVAVGGLYLGRRLYMPAPATEPLERLGWLHRLLVNKYYLDDFYMKGIVRPIRDSISAAMYWLNQNVFDAAVNGAAAIARAGARKLYDNVDQKVIDGTVNAVGIGTQDGSRLLRYIQSGDVQRYAAVLFGGVAA